MFQKDYLMRIIQTLLEGIDRIVNCIENGDIENAKIQITNNYDLLGGSSTFFKEVEIEQAIDLINKQENSTFKNVLVLAQTMYLDARTQKSIALKNTLLKKSISYFEYYLEHTKEYSFKLIQQLNEIKSHLT